MVETVICMHKEISVTFQIQVIAALEPLLLWKRENIPSMLKQGRRWNISEILKMRVCFIPSLFSYKPLFLG